MLLRDVAQSGLAHLHGVQGVGGSNPLVPTIITENDRSSFGKREGFFCCVRIEAADFGVRGVFGYRCKKNNHAGNVELFELCRYCFVVRLLMCVFLS